MNWTQKIAFIFISCLIISCGFHSYIFAQTTELTEQEEELTEEAEESMDKGDYENALSIYSQLLSLHTDDVFFRYKYAACLIHLNQDIEKAIEYLNIAKSKAKTEIPQIHYYYGMAYHLRYRFDKAIRHYSRFNPKDVRRRVRDKYPVQRQIRMARNGKKLIQYAYVLDVIDKKNLKRDNFYYSYDLADIGGEFVKKHPSLQSRYDKKHEESPIAFISHKHDKLMFSSYGRRGKTGKDIYFADRQPDGTWGEPYKLDHPVNTNEDDAYPFLHPNGKHLYFSSKGHNSMGGYDLFVSRYKENSEKWGAPQNLDFPVNSPLDDVLYVTDSTKDFAIFASNRDAKEHRRIVYKIKIKEDKEKREIENMQDIRSVSRLELSPLADQMEMREESTKEDEDKKDEDEDKKDTKEADVVDSDKERPTDKDLAAYFDLRETVESDFETLDMLFDQGEDKLNQFKHTIIDAKKSGDTELMLDAAEIHHMFRQKLNNLKSDKKELNSNYQELPEQPRKKPGETLMNTLESIHASNQRIIEQYKNIDILAELDKKLDEQIEKLESNKKKLAQLEQQLKKNLEKANNQEAASPDESLQKLQNDLKNRYIQIAYEQKLDSLKIKDIKRQIENAKNILAQLDSKSTDTITLPERKISEVSFDIRKKRISNLSGQRNDIEKATNNKYGIGPWYKNKDYQDFIEKTLTQAKNQSPPISESEMRDHPELAENINTQKQLYTEAEQIRKQIENETDEKQIQDLHRELKQKTEKLEKINKKVNKLTEDSDLIAERDQRTDADNDTDSQQESSDKMPEDNDEETEIDKAISEIYDPREISNSTETVRKELSQPEQKSPESAEEKIRHFQNNINEKSKQVTEVHQGYFTQLKTAFNTLKNHDELAGEESKIQEAENMMEEAEGFELAAQNNDDPVRKISFYEKAEKKARQANQLLNELYEEKTNNKLADFTPPDLPSASEYKAFENRQTEKLTEVDTESGKQVKTAGGGYTVQVKEKIFNKTDSLARADETMDARLQSTPNMIERIQLTSEKDIINFKMGESLNKLIHAERNDMNNRIENNHKKLKTLAEMGKIDENEIPNPETNKIIPPEKQDISPSMRKQQMAEATDLFEHKMNVLSAQENLLNSVRKKARAPLSPEWYDIQSKLINRKYNRPPDMELTEALSIWDESAADDLTLSGKQKNEISEIQSQKEDIAENIEETETEMEEIKAKSWSQNRIKKRTDKLKKELNTDKLALQKLEFDEQKQFLEAQKDMEKTPKTPIEEIADQIADSLESIAMRTHKLMNLKDDITENEKRKNLAYATGLLKEANNLRHLRIESGADTKQMLEKLTMHYRPEKPGILAEADTHTDVKEPEERDVDNREQKAKDTDREKEMKDADREQDIREASEDVTPEEQRDGINEYDERDTQTRSEDRESYDSDDTTEPAGSDSEAEAAEEEETEVDKPGSDFYYRIQIAALDEPLNGDRFRNLSPVVNEQVGNRQLYRYLCGKFYNTNSWQRPLTLIKSIGFEDAFVVAYLNGRRLNLSQAQQYQNLERDLPAEFNYHGSESLISESSSETQESQTTDQSDQDVMATNINQFSESFFTVQIGVYSRILENQNVKGINTDYYNRTNEGYYRYFHGKFSTRAEAQRRCDQINNQIEDAFVTLHVGGRPYSPETTSEPIESVAERFDINIVKEQTQATSSDTAGVTPEIRIQIGAFAGQMDQAILQQYAEKFAPYNIVIMRKGRYHYYQLTGFSNYAEAKYILRRRVKPEVPDAFFTAYRGNIKIPVHRALLIMKND
ncbi:MAG: SPOR domain-containing protein [Bacteroidales bacterium]